MYLYAISFGQIGPLANKFIPILENVSQLASYMPQIKEGVNYFKEDPNYDLFKLALKSTAKRLYPNYANVDWSGNEGYDRNDPRTYFSTMGERKLWPM